MFIPLKIQRFNHNDLRTPSFKELSLESLVTIERLKKNPHYYNNYEEACDSHFNEYSITPYNEHLFYAFRLQIISSNSVVESFRGYNILTVHKNSEITITPDIPGYYFRPDFSCMHSVRTDVLLKFIGIDNTATEDKIVLPGLKR